MTFTQTTSPNLLDYCSPYDDREYLFGDDLCNLHGPTKFTPSPLVNYFVPDHSWDSDIFADTNVVQRPTADETHPFGRAFPFAWMLGSLFQLAPTILSSSLLAQNEPPRSEPVNEERADKGKGKARAVDLDDTDKCGPEPAPAEDETFAEVLRGVMAASMGADSRILSPDEAGPSGSSALTVPPNATPPPLGSTSPPQTYPSGSGSEQAEIDHAILVSSIERIENTLLALQANFTFPARLDCRMPSNTDLRVSDPTEGDANGYIAEYLLTTPANSTVLDFVQALRGLLLQLGHVDTKNDVEAGSMKLKVAGVINAALEGVESEVEEEIGRWMSL